MKVKLKEVHAYTHQIESSSDDELAAMKGDFIIHDSASLVISTESFTPCENKYYFHLSGAELCSLFMTNTFSGKVINTLGRRGAVSQKGEGFSKNAFRTIDVSTIFEEGSSPEPIEISCSNSD